MYKRAMMVHPLNTSLTNRAVVHSLRLVVQAMSGTKVHFLEHVLYAFHVKRSYSITSKHQDYRQILVIDLRLIASAAR